MTRRAGRAFPITAATTLTEAAVTIATAFNREGIAAVLTGPAASAIHTRGRACCRQLDYALTPPVSPNRLATALRHLGFDDTPGAGAHAHADADFSLRLTNQPVPPGSGGGVLGQTLKLKTGYVRVLAPADCCRQWLLRWRTTQSDDDLREAVDIATCCDVSMADMRMWMRSEQIAACWAPFRRLVEGARAEPSRLR